MVSPVEPLITARILWTHSRQWDCPTSMNDGNHGLDFKSRLDGELVLAISFKVDKHRQIVQAMAKMGEPLP